MAILGFELEEILRVLALVEAQELERFVWKDEERSIRIVRQRSPQSKGSAIATIPEGQPLFPTAPRLVRRKKKQETSFMEPLSNPDEIRITAPMVGTFYRSEKSGSPPIIEVGQMITKGMPIGIIEAMKIYSEIPSEVEGIVVSIPARDGRRA